MGTKLVYLNRRQSHARGKLATSRPHEFLSKRSELLKQRSSLASDEVRGQIKSDLGLFWESSHLAAND